MLLALTSESCKNLGFCDRCAAQATGCLFQTSHMQCCGKILVLYGSNAYPVKLHVAWNPNWIECLPIIQEAMMSGKKTFMCWLSSAHFNGIEYIIFYFCMPLWTVSQKWSQRIAAVSCNFSHGGCCCRTTYHYSDDHSSMYRKLLDCQLKGHMLACRVRSSTLLQ